MTLLTARKRVFQLENSAEKKQVHSFHYSEGKENGIWYWLFQNYSMAMFFLIAKQQQVKILSSFSGSYWFNDISRYLLSQIPALDSSKHVKWMNLAGKQTNNKSPYILCCISLWCISVKDWDALSSHRCDLKVALCCSLGNRSCHFPISSFSYDPLPVGKSSLWYLI